MWCCVLNICQGGRENVGQDNSNKNGFKLLIKWLGDI